MFNISKGALHAANTHLTVIISLHAIVNSHLDCEKNNERICLTWMILIEAGTYQKYMSSPVWEPVMSNSSSTDEFEWQGFHDNYNKWACAQEWMLIHFEGISI